MSSERLFRLERIFQSIKLQPPPSTAPAPFRLERIFQSIKLAPARVITDAVFRLPRSFPPFPLTALWPANRRLVPARAHFPID